MDELKAIFASNLIKLRQGSALTQAELGERIHYSDKSISKWERAEAIPDAYVLTRLAQEFGVTVNDLLTADSRWKPEVEEMQKPVTYSRLFVVLCAVAAIWTFAIITFVVLWIVSGIHWAVLLLCVPLTLVTVLVFNSIWNHGRRNMIVIGLLVLCVVLLLVYVFRQWKILLVLIPAEIVVYLACNIRKRKKSETTESNET